MESRRLNAQNQDFQNQQQRELLRDQQRLGTQQGEMNLLGPNQLGPSSRLQSDRTFRRGVGIGAPVNWQFLLDELWRHGLRAEGWRVVNDRGRWWYWTPEESWMYYNYGSWVAYPGDGLYGGIVVDRREVSFPPGYPPDQWRLVYHNGRWWFWAPNRTWLYLSGDNWIRWWGHRENVAGARRAMERQSVGYRGNGYQSDGYQGDDGRDGVGRQPGESNATTSPDRTTLDRRPVPSAPPVSTSQPQQQPPAELNRSNNPDQSSDDAAPNSSNQ
jgi:hypothetical protein